MAVEQFGAAGFSIYFRGHPNLEPTIGPVVRSDRILKVFYTRSCFFIAISHSFSLNSGIFHPTRHDIKNLRLIL